MAKKSKSNSSKTPPSGKPPRRRRNDGWLDGLLIKQTDAVECCLVQLVKEMHNQGFPIYRVLKHFCTFSIPHNIKNLFVFQQSRHPPDKLFCQITKNPILHPRSTFRPLFRHTSTIAHHQKTSFFSDSCHHPAPEVIVTNVSLLIRSMISQNKALGTATSAI